ncbi:MAG: hypothetical protein M1814_000935 [Vezdaea aestivalis]|nr:MAG: hypothetical protein M1814_000935 [Vezdaea aestivalis]
MYDKYALVNHIYLTTEIIDALEDALLAAPPISIAIDGLDDLSSLERRSFLSALEELRSLVQSLRLIFSTRPEPAILEVNFFEDTPVLRIDKDQVNEDIASYVRANLIESHLGHTPDMRSHDERVDLMIKRAGGSFLYTKMLLRELEDAPTEQQWKQRLDSLPTTLDGMYGHILSSLDVDRTALTVLKWLSICPTAVSPTEFEEIGNNLIFMAGPESLPEPLDIESIIQTTGGLMVVDDSTDTVQLVHPSLHAWLRERRVFLSTDDMFYTMASLCISHIVGHGDYILRMIDLETSPDLLFSRIPLLKHASQWWAYYASHQKAQLPLKALLGIYRDAWLRTLRASSTV